MNYKKVKKGVAILTVGTLMTLSMAGCSWFGNNSSSSSSSESTALEDVDLDNLFSKRDLDSSYDENSPKITFSDENIASESSDATVEDNTVTISAAGTYILTGTSADAQVVVDVGDSDKVQLVFDNLNLTSTEATALYVKQADKVFITQAEGSNNSISIDSESEEIDEKNVDGAIFARDDVTFNGTGTLTVTSSQTHGIVCKDDLKLVSGTINVTSAKHAMEANDSISVKDATINIDAGKDGLHCDEYVNVVGGDINITKANEGIEGQVINIAGGDTKIVASDDGINASLADSTSSMDPMSGDSNIKLNIIDGKLTVNASGDGIDSNGVINISGGETYISGPTSDGDTAIDYGTECIITGGTVIAAGSSGMVEEMSSNSTQPVMTVNASSNSGTITLADASGNELASYTPDKQYACVTLSAPQLTVGETYTVKCGETTEEVTLSETVYSEVQSMMGGGMGGMRGGMQGGDMQGQGGMPSDMQNGTSGNSNSNNIKQGSRNQAGNSQKSQTKNSDGTTGNVQPNINGGTQNGSTQNGNMPTPPDMNGQSGGGSQGQDGQMPQGGQMPNGGQMNGGQAPSGQMPQGNTKMSEPLQDENNDNSNVFQNIVSGIEGIFTK